MRRIIHLSDLHFGRVRQEIIEPLLETVADIGPDLVAISGDLTQRARESQFAEARALIDRLPAPIVVVPGNHDVPLDNLPVRILNPFRRYRRYISENLEPSFSDEEMEVIGVNTVNPLGWQRGLFTKGKLSRACSALGGGPQMRIAVAHHPFEHLPTEPKTLMRGATRGISELSECGFRVVLSGHLHTWRAQPVATRLDGAHVLQIQAGTGLSTRLRGEENDFNLLTLEGQTIHLERWVAGAETTRFTRHSALTYHLEANRWRKDALEAEGSPS